MRDKKGRFVNGNKHSEETIKKISNSLMGRTTWNKGKKLSDEHKLKLSRIKKQMAKIGQLKGLFNKGTDERRTKTQFEEGHKLHWKNLKGRKTENESKLESLIHKLSLPYKFVGDGKVTLERICPDFINCNGQKKIIEIHSSKDSGWYNKRKEIFAHYGYRWLFVRNKELNDIDLLTIKLCEFDES